MLWELHQIFLLPQLGETETHRKKKQTKKQIAQACCREVSSSSSTQTPSLLQMEPAKQKTSAS